MNPLTALVKSIRLDDPNRQVPDFDPAGGGVDSEILFLLEAPGPMAVAGKGSGFISPDNNDGSAKRFKAQLQVAGLDRKRMVIWNIVPWYLGDGKSIDSASGKNIADARRYLDQLIELLPRLKFVVLVGGKARSALVYLSRHDRFHILGLHHTSNQSFRIDRRPQFDEENLASLKRLALACGHTQD